MGNHKIAQLIILLLNLGTLLASLACPSCQNPPVLYPPVKPPTAAKPPVLYPPVISIPPSVPKPYPSPPPPENPYPPLPAKTCSIDASKLGGCVDALDGSGSGQSANEACCPVVDGLLDLDAAICLCAAIKAKLLNIDILIKLVLKVLVGCGKNPPSGFQCHA